MGSHLGLRLFLHRSGLRRSQTVSSFLSKRKISIATLRALSQQVPWYERIEDETARSQVLEYRNTDYTHLDGNRLLELGERWIRNDASVQFEIQIQNKHLPIRPLWVSIYVTFDGRSQLFLSFLPIDETTQDGFLDDADPQANFPNASFISMAFR